MTVYAVFLCIAATGSCREAAPGRWSDSFGYIPGTVYSSLADCRRNAAIFNRGMTNMRYRCFGKHVDAWRPR